MLHPLLPHALPGKLPSAHSLLVTASAAESALLVTVVSARLVAPSSTWMARALTPGALQWREIVWAASSSVRDGAIQAIKQHAAAAWPTHAQPLSTTMNA